jgi:hypothetical protein
MSWVSFMTAHPWIPMRVDDTPDGFDLRTGQCRIEVLETATTAVNEVEYLKIGIGS